MLRVSVVIPVYNGSGFLSSTFEALARQSLDGHQFEVIAVDDGSTDDSVARLKAIKDAHPRFSITIFQKGNGVVSSARNAGARLAKAELLAFLDQDATPLPDWLESGLKVLDSPDVTAVEGRITPERNFPATALTNILENETGGRFMTANFFIRKPAFDSVGGFDENFPYYLEDSDLAFSLLRQGYHIRWSPEVRISHPYIQKTMRQHVWQMTKLAERVPLLLGKHQVSRSFCLRHGIPWRTMTACPLHFYGYHLALSLVVVGLGLPHLQAKVLYLLGAGVFAVSYLFTLYTRFRNRMIVPRELVLFMLWYLVIPYMRLYYLAAGARKFGVPIRFI